MAAFAAFAAGCAVADGSVGSSGEEEHLGASASAIYAGTSDNDGSASPAVVAIKIGNSSQSFELCSGALIGPNVVLTARHCVSENIVPSVSCDENGVSGNGPSGNGDQVGADAIPSTIHVFVGASPDLRNGTPAANGKQIVHPSANILCNSDIALIVLDQKITAAKPLPIRLSAATSLDETVRTVGYGENDKNLPIGTRLRKTGVALLAVGTPSKTTKTPIASHELEVGLSICQGDSGGPAISEETGAVIGVVSRGGSCTSDRGHIYTQTNGFAALIDSAFKIAGGAPVAEVTTGSGSGASFGHECTADADCGSSVCVAQGDTQFCSSTCRNDDGCPSGYTCSELLNDGTSRVCASSAVDAVVRSVDPIGSGSNATASNKLRAGANAGACSARIAGDGTTDRGAFALVAALAGAVVLERRRRRAR